MEKTTISIDDFTTGIIAGLAYLGYKSVYLKDFDTQVVKAFREWEPEAEKTHRLTFWLTLHSIYGDSAEVRGAFKHAVYTRDLGFFTDTSLAFNVSKNYSIKYLENLPGELELWLSLANKIVNQEALLSRSVMV